VKRTSHLNIILTFAALRSILISQNIKGRIVNRMRLITSIFKIFISLLLITALTTFINAPASQAVVRTVAGTVTKVSDGDSIQVVTPEQTKLKVRLYGIDAPETAKISDHSGDINKVEPYAEESTRALTGKVKGCAGKAGRHRFRQNTGAWCAWSG
jgi:endonuclease YncB( thermonuclease family)